MGYTHYWRCPKEGYDKNKGYAGAKKLAEYSQKAIDKHVKTGLPLEDIQVSKRFISFNGVGEDAYETFYLELCPDSQSFFCKTGARPYDAAVCDVLLLAEHFIPGFYLKSDGFTPKRPEPAWIESVKRVEELLGIKLERSSAIYGTENEK